MYCLITVNGAPPTVATKYELVHSVGRRLLSHGNSCRNKRELRPLGRLTKPVDAELRIYLSQQMYMVWHHFQFDDFRLQLSYRLVDDLLQTYIHIIHQYRASVLGAPNNMVFA